MSARGAAPWITPTASWSTSTTGAPATAPIWAESCSIQPQRQLLLCSGRVTWCRLISGTAALSNFGQQHVKCCCKVLCRLMNLELLLKFGPTSWKVHNASLEAYNSRCAADVADTCASVMKVAPVDWI